MTDRHLGNTTWFQKEGHGFFHLSKTDLESPSGTCLEVCLYGDSKFSTAIVKIEHHTLKGHGD